jgi:hypothetical protein
MNDKVLAQIRANMAAKQTADLQNIWESNDKEEYSEEAFKIVREILEERCANLPSQKKAKIPDDTKDQRFGKKKTPEQGVKFAVFATLWMGVGHLFWAVFVMTKNLSVLEKCFGWVDLPLLPGLEKYGWVNLLLGGVFIYLWTLVRKRNKAALVTAIVLTGALIAVKFLYITQDLFNAYIPPGFSYVPPGFSGTVVAIGLFISMIKGLLAIPPLSPSKDKK